MPGPQVRLADVLSVVIPTLNEAACLPQTLALLRRRHQDPGVEVVVADCSSTDRTVDLAVAEGCRVVTGATSRATAMNLGARHARGTVLLFLHADSQPPIGFDLAVMSAVRRGCIGGAFDFNWASHPRNRGVNRELLRFVRVSNRIRFRWTGNFYGDQGIFVRRDVFERLGGYPDAPLMEDVRLCQKLKRRGKLAVLSPGVKTSPRRFLVHGVFWQFLADLRLLSMESLGLNPAGAWSAYNQLNRSGHTLPDPTGTDDTRDAKTDPRSVSRPIPVNSTPERV